MRYGMPYGMRYEMHTRQRHTITLRNMTKQWNYYYPHRASVALFLLAPHIVHVALGLSPPLALPQPQRCVDDASAALESGAHKPGTEQPIANAVSRTHGDAPSPRACEPAASALPVSTCGSTETQTPSYPTPAP